MDTGMLLKSSALLPAESLRCLTPLLTMTERAGNAAGTEESPDVALLQAAAAQSIAELPP